MRAAAEICLPFFPGTISSLTEMRFFFLGTLALLKRSWPASPKKECPGGHLLVWKIVFYLSLPQKA